MTNTVQLVEKWKPILDQDGFDPIKDPNRRAVTATLLENHAGVRARDQEYLTEAAPTNVTGNVDRYDPILVKLIRRMAPKLIAYDVCGVQPLSGPSGLIFALKSRYGDQGDEAFMDEPNTAYSGAGQHTSSDIFDPAYSTGTGMATSVAEGDNWNEMSFSIEKTSVTASSHQLKATYSLELAQDMESVHGLNAENELINILSTELTSEVNRKVLRNIYTSAKFGAQFASTPGVLDMSQDVQGRHMLENFRGLVYSIDKDANRIAIETRRGRGNFIICSPDVASALDMAGTLDKTSIPLNELDPVGTSFVGKYKGVYNVYVDPYVSSDFYVVGYKGANVIDSGIFFSPYQALQMVRATDPTSFHTAIGFKHRSAITANPFTTMNANGNVYYRKVKVINL